MEVAVSEEAIKAAIKLLRKAGWTLDPPEEVVSAPVQIEKVKVRRDPPNPLTPEVLHQHMRISGFTANAINYPLSDRAYAWLCDFNGAQVGQTPWTWRYAPNPYMQSYLDRRAGEEGF